MAVLYKDTYVVVDRGNHKLRLIDTASCQVTTIQGTEIANDSYSVTFTNGSLYIGGQGYIVELPVEVVLSASGEMTTSGPGCSPFLANSTLNATQIVNEASCEQIITSTTVEANTTTETLTTTTSMEKTGLPIWGIGIIAGIGGLLLIVAIIVICLVICKKKNRVEHSEEPN
ncbi:uncharacterized protein [Watersipora subatra]|uniref:uncharacterized protein n=1 Tax=Watersipora subatra TaxID=2589382 RepID=UPI00355B0468